MQRMFTRRTVIAGIAIAAVAALALSAYLFLQEPRGTVDTVDTTLAAPTQGADSTEYYAQLAAHLEKQPRDARAWAIYARLNFSRDRFAEAAAAYAHAVELPGRVAQDPLIWCEYADALAMANGGQLAGQPRQLIDRALTLNPRHPRALEMAGSAEIERGDYAEALRYWEKLLEVLPPDSAQYREMVTAVERTRMRANR
jgi:cytochrome c-type biogenesis protein CcmH